MSRFAVLVYPDFSLQEITCLTSALSVWFNEPIDFLASENREYQSEEGLRILPAHTFSDVSIADYDCLILPGTINPLPALYDERLIDFLKSGIHTDVVPDGMKKRSAPVKMTDIFCSVKRGAE